MKIRWTLILDCEHVIVLIRFYGYKLGKNSVKLASGIKQVCKQSRVLIISSETFIRTLEIYIRLHYFKMPIIKSTIALWQLQTKISDGFILGQVFLEWTGVTLSALWDRPEREAQTERGTFSAFRVYERERVSQVEVYPI